MCCARAGVFTVFKHLKLSGHVTTGCLLHGVSLTVCTLSGEGYSALQQCVPAFLHWLADQKTGPRPPPGVRWSLLPRERPLRWQSVIDERNKDWADLRTLCLFLCWGTEPQDLQEGAPSSAAAGDTWLPAQLLKGGNSKRKKWGAWPLRQSQVNMASAYLHPTPTRSGVPVVSEELWHH